MAGVRWAALLLLLAACGSTRVADRAADGRAILICGDQPDRQQLRRLHELHGVRTVVNLRGAEPGEAWFEEERRAVEAIGARWVHIDTTSRAAPPPEDLARFFDVVEDPESWPVYVHCQMGMHRTGLMCAVYRRQYQGWTAERALQEMRSRGFDIGKGDRSAARAFIREYEPDPARTVDRGKTRGQ